MTNRLPKWPARPYLSFEDIRGATRVDLRAVGEGREVEPTHRNVELYEGPSGSRGEMTASFRNVEDGVYVDNVSEKHVVAWMVG